MDRDDQRYPEARRTWFRTAINDLLSAVEAVRATAPEDAARAFGGMELAILETAWHDLNDWRERYRAALAEAEAEAGSEPVAKRTGGAGPGSER